MAQLNPVPEEEPIDQSDVSSADANPSSTQFENSDSPMPTSAMPEKMAEYIRAIADRNGLSHDLCAATALGVLSAAIGAGIWLESGRGLKLAGNLYIVISARSGTGKSVAFRQISERLHAEQTRILKEWQAKVENDKDDTSPWPGFIMTNATSEALAKALEVNPGCAAALLTPDARGAIDIIFGRYTKGQAMDLDLYLTAWSYDSLVYARRHGGCYAVQSPCLSLFFAVQPDKMADFCAAPAFLESGMAARILMLRVPQERRDEGEEAPADIIAWWEGTVEAALQLRQNGDNALLIRMTAEARVVCDALKREQDWLLKKGKTQALDSVISRLAEQAMRLALVFHVARYGEEAGAHELHVQDMEGGAHLARWFLAQAASMLSPVAMVQNDKLRQRALDAFERRKSSEITVRILRDHHGLDRDSLDRLVATFPEEFELVVRHNGQGAGRPSEVLTKLAR
jgi:hypothetical protein